MRLLQVRCDHLKRVFGESGFSGILCFAILIFGCGAYSVAAAQPNIIFILTDDQGPDSVEGIPAYSNNLHCHTPNLALWASQGVVFSNARVNPNCSPTRATLLSGRYALQTGVTGVLHTRESFRQLVSLQGHEDTIGEALHRAGYYTIFVDKWHVGESPELGQTPTQQGFDFQVPRSLKEIDKPEVVGDEYITWLVDQSVSAVQNRPDPTQPYALFFWTNDPHWRDPDASGLQWWKVDTSLLPSGEDYYTNESQRNRYRAVVESVDTELGRLLQTLGVTDSSQSYQTQSNTVVLFAGDNGTDRLVAKRPGHAKKTLFDGGIRVPFFMFGEKVPVAEVTDAPTSGVDVYDTFSDIAGVPAQQRGIRPRAGLSFADLIGWSNQTLPRHDYTISSLGRPDPETQTVALTDGHYKLVCKSGGAGLALRSLDEFYNLDQDPEENNNLISENINGPDKRAYLNMRDAIVNSWATSVSTPSTRQIDIPASRVFTIDNKDHRNGAVGYLDPSKNNTVESRLFAYFPSSRIRKLLPRGTKPSDVVGVQLILDYQGDLDTTAASDTLDLMVFPMTINWFDSQVVWNDVKDSFDPNFPCGSFDPAPNIVTDPPNSKLTGLPMPSGTPVSFGQSENLFFLVADWINQPDQNFGIVVKGIPDDSLDGEQRIAFFKSALLRISLKP